MPQPADLARNMVLLGEFGRPHGLNGAIRLKSFTDDPVAIARYGELLGRDGRRFTITQARQAAGDQRDLLVVNVAGVASREAAEALNRVALLIERARLGTPEDDEFYLADLLGLQARRQDGSDVGRVVGVPNYGGGELLEIRSDGGTFLLPFTKAFVPVVDLAGGFVVIDPPRDDHEPD